MGTGVSCASKSRLIKGENAEKRVCKYVRDAVCSLYNPISRNHASPICKKDFLRIGGIELQFEIIEIEDD